MSTSDKNATSAITPKTIAGYAAAAVGCLAFSLIYAQFSHGVSSLFMSWMCAIPALGGAVVALVRGACKIAEVSKLSSYSFRLGIITLAVASTLKGIFEIAGTDSAYVVGFVIAGAALIAVSAAGFFTHKATPSAG